MLRIEHYTKRFGAKIAVDDLSLHIAPGEIYGFIGHNGAGKTTTLKACAGILSPDAGEIFVDGISMQEDPFSCKKQMAYIPDNPAIYGYLTGIQYLKFIGDIYHLDSATFTERVRTLSTKLDLEAALGQPVSTYSHGMKQRLALISAWLHAPKLIMMDEPFVGLDPQAAHTLKEMMHAHCQAGGAIFFSTHVLDVAEKLCDKIAIIQEGKLLRAGATQDVRGDATLEDTFLKLLEDDNT